MISKDYIIGLVDGEGSFTVFLRRVGKYRKAELHFYLKMRKEELPLLRKVKQFFDCGHISLQRDKRKNHSDCYRFEIGNIKELKEKVIPTFKGKLNSQRRRKDFEIFCRILRLVERKRHLTPNGWKNIEKLKNDMHK
jgi:hypothetical protein